MNVKLLREIAAYIKAEPQRFIMAEGLVFLGDSGEFHDKETDFTVNPPCGTAACIAGTAYLLTQKPRRVDATEDNDANDCRMIPWSDINATAREVLGIDYEQSKRLFRLTHWSEVNQTRFADAETQQDRVNVAVDEIEKFISENK